MIDDHCVIQNNTLLCTRCERTTPLGLPLSVNELTERAKAFILLHQRCLLPTAHEHIVEGE